MALVMVLVTCVGMPCVTARTAVGDGQTAYAPLAKPPRGKDQRRSALISSSAQPTSFDEEEHELEDENDDEDENERGAGDGPVFASPTSLEYPNALFRSGDMVWVVQHGRSPGRYLEQSPRPPRG